MGKGKAILGLVFFLGLTALEGGEETVVPAPGVFLVAKPSIDGGPFFHSVVLLLSHDEDGSLGLIVNRVSDVPVDEAIPDLRTKARELTLQFGGPVGMDGLLFLFRSDDAPDGVAHVMNDVYFSGDRRVLESILRARRPNQVRVFLGHSGWAPDQLDGEIRRGDWELVRAAPDEVFGDAPETLWPRLTKAGRVTAALGERLLELVDPGGSGAGTYARRIVVKSTGRTTFLDTDEVLWIEAQGVYVTLHTASGEHLLRESLSGLESRLDPARFARVHRSAVIALGHVRELRSDATGAVTAVLRDGRSLRVSRRHRAELERRLHES